MKQRDLIGRIWNDVSFLLGIVALASYVLDRGSAVSSWLMLAFLLWIWSFDAGTRAVERLVRRRTRQPKQLAAGSRHRRSPR